MQSECFGRSRSDATRSEEKVRYSTFTLDNWYKANLTPMLCNKISCVFLKVKEIIIRNDVFQNPKLDIF